MTFTVLIITTVRCGLDGCGVSVGATTHIFATLDEVVAAEKAVELTRTSITRLF